MARIVILPTAGVSNAMAAYTIGFVRLEVHDRVEDAVGAGSGTLVSVGKVRGILTAAHVCQSAWGPCADRHAKPLIRQAVEGASLDASSHVRVI
jgi:hypothetical protein